MKSIHDNNDEYDAPGQPKRRLLGASLAAAGAAALAAQATLELSGLVPAPAGTAPPAPGGTNAKAGTPGSSAPAGKVPLPTTDVRLDFMKSTAVRGPATPPFMVELPIPRVKEEESSLSPEPTREAGKDEAGRPPHQVWERYPPRKFYELRVREEDHSFHPNLPGQRIWGYDGVTPGPTLVVRYGEPVLVRIENDLPDDHRGFGSPEISTHLHNGHTPSESDGFPGDYYSRDKYGPTLTRAGRYKDHHYPNKLSNTSDFPDSDGDPAAALGTLWYHDHRMEFTSANVYRGLAGFYLIFDGVDTGDERDTTRGALRLPSGVGKYDIPLVFQDRSFDSGGYLYFNQFDPEGIVGEKFLVNGKIQPYFSVARRKYRFRCLNGSAVRFYQFYLVHDGKEQKFLHIANDGNLLPAPLEVDKLRLANAERGDIIVDFSKFPLGSKVYFVNRLQHLDGRGPTGLLLSPGTQILRFDVDREPDEPDLSQVPAVLRPLAPPVIPKNVRVRRWEFDRENDQWTINGRLFDINRPATIIKRGVDEIWELQGKGSWHHPIHIHFEEARILTRNGLPPPPHERGRKDVFELKPGEVVRILICFDDFVGKYIMHCHNTVHEDHHMMVRFDVVA
ncbi:MAG: hypothetical protein JWP72_1817 [Massilia sp.]|nr:hypothetical protein [Massilia sp.]